MTPLTWELINHGTGSAPQQITQILYKCDHCGRLSIATVQGFIGGNQITQVDAQINEQNSNVMWLPRIGVAAEYSNVPSYIASAASEAHECASIGAFRAAILLARTVIEASAKSKDIITGTLKDKITKMAVANIIRPMILETAMGIKDFGNEMAHGDIEKDVTIEDATEILELMSVVLNEVFQIEAQTRSLRARLMDRKAQHSEDQSSPTQV